MAVPYSRSLADIRAEQADHLDRMKSVISGMNLKDVLPILVARNVVKSYEMGAVYSKKSQEEQLEAFIALLKTKNHWIGPMTDALIRNGQAPLAQQFMAMNRT